QSDDSAVPAATRSPWHRYSRPSRYHPANASWPNLIWLRLVAFQSARSRSPFPSLAMHHIPCKSSWRSPHEPRVRSHSRHKMHSPSNDQNASACPVRPEWVLAKPTSAPPIETMPPPRLQILQSTSPNRCRREIRHCTLFGFPSTYLKS